MSKKIFNIRKSKRKIVWNEREDEILLEHTNKNERKNLSNFDQVFNEFLENGSKKICNYCWDQSKKDFFDTKLKVNLLGEYINLNEKKKNL